MAVREILKIPEPVLKQVSSPVEVFDDELQTLVQDMLDTMYDAPGIGLAAVQIGITKRLLVTDVAGKDEDPQPLCLINPELTWVSEEMSEYEEGCLSIPEVYDNVSRPSEITVTFKDQHGEAQELNCGGLLATCIQHEIDHLNGILFIDHLSRLKRERAVKKFTKNERQTKSSS